MATLNNQQFDTKWGEAQKGSPGEEFSIFVPPGRVPETQRQLFLFNYYQLFKQFTRGRKIESVLEMGCGRGTLSLYYALYEHAQVSLFDISEEGVELAHKNFDYHNAQGTIFLGDAKKVSLPNDSFDLVFSIGLLEHLDDYEKVVAEKYRLTKPGGVVVSLNIPKKFSIQFLNKIHRFFVRLFGGTLKLKKDYYRNASTPEEYKATFEKVGFKTCRIVPVAPFPILTPLSGFSERMLTRIYRMLLILRAPFKKHPFMASRLLSQAHFIVCEK